MSNIYKIVKVVDIKFKLLYFQYVPDRFEKAFGVKPSAETLHISQLPHCDLLRRYMNSKSAVLTDTNYYRMHSCWGRNEKWINKKIKRFVKLFENISKTGLKGSIVVTKPPLYKKFHDGYEIYEGHHRASVYLVLGNKSISSEIVRFT